MTEVSPIESLAAELQRSFFAEPHAMRVLRSPYRICPLGAHIDHQLGRVTAMALDRAIHLAYVATDAREMRLRSLAFPGEIGFGFDAVPPPIPSDWGNYARGAVAALGKCHHLHRGILGVTAGGLGEGGLSSSAAIGVAYLLALEEANGLAISPWENVELDRRIENDYLGVRNGILDQGAILFSRRDHLTVIDCKAAAHELIPLATEASDHRWLIAFSGVRESITATGYNLRVEECSRAARTLLDAVGRHNERPLLGHISAEEYATHATRLDGAPAKRARHFFDEIERVEQGIAAWRRGDLVRFGELMSASGRSSIELYECGSPPLIDLYRALLETPGVLGARFSGAGFRGCCVALVEANRAESAAEAVRRTYAERQPKLANAAPVLICRSADGAGFL